MAVVVAEDVSRSYGEVVALDGVSLRIEEGEIFALVGPNGAGKTTLVRALTGTTEAEGRVELFGAPPRAVDAERVGLLPQAFDPPGRLTARELVDFYGGLYDDPEPAGKLLDAVGIDDDGTYYENLSGGQKRRTCVATALVNDPDLLVLDEPTTGIDPAGRRTLWELLLNLAAGGTTVFLTTHYMEEAETLADRVGLLADGELVAVDTPTALVAEYGGKSLLYVDGQFDGSALETLSYEGSLEDGRLTLRDVPPTAIGDVVRELDGLGVGYDALTWTEPDLEDVYLALAGREGKSEPAERGEPGPEVDDR